MNLKQAEKHGAVKSPKVGEYGYYEEPAYDPDEIDNLEIDVSKMVDVGKVGEFFDNKDLRVFDPTDAKYKNVRITSKQAEEIANDIVTNINELLKE